MTTQRKRSVSRTAALTVLLLVAGLAINIAVTWACARWGDHSPEGASSGADFFGTLPADAEPYLNDPERLRRFGPDRPTGLTRSITSSWTCTREELTRWHDHRMMAYSRSHTRIRFGFPSRSFEYVEHSSHNVAAFPEDASWRAEGWRGGWPLATDRNSQNIWSYTGPDRIYPLAPIPLGLLANTAFYALLTFAFIRFLVILRRRGRRNRGLCPRCAYPIGSSPVCTECGTPVPRANSAE